jgi:hypothetical protein
MLWHQGSMVVLSDAWKYSYGKWDFIFKSNYGEEWWPAYGKHFPIKQTKKLDS